ncbi:hypothetical protein PRZ48_006553 [Zasmidium cellare]|uniref:BTB domain-containing protein n=1 Tax=Zasmidium cellare TaxID=395010 RepID=A0ABR0EPD9_ZASCE|nr:hypothetical protein PRZ48_006553 [Zasmidium cellare]
MASNDSIAGSAASQSVVYLLKKCADRLRRLLASEDNPDLTIICESNQWKVHKSVVCSQSSFFKAACKKEWTASTPEQSSRVSTYPEQSDTSVINIGSSTKIVNVMINFMYHSTYSDEWFTTSQADCGPMAFNLKVFNAADLYDIPGLRKLAQAKLLSRLDEMASFEDFRDTIKVLYGDGETPPSATAIRRKVLAIAMEIYAPSANKRRNSVKGNSIDDLVEDYPVFGKELAVALLNSAQQLRSQVEKGERSLHERQGYFRREQDEHEAMIYQYMAEKADLAQQAGALRLRQSELDKKEEYLKEKETNMQSELDKKEGWLKDKETNMQLEFGKKEGLLKKKEANMQSELDKKEAYLKEREANIKKNKESYDGWNGVGELYPRFECGDCSAIFLMITSTKFVDISRCPLCNAKPRGQSRWKKLKALFS